MVKRIALLLTTIGVVVAAIVVAVVTLSGGDDDGDAVEQPTGGPTNAPGNLFLNGDFEQGLEPWRSLDPNATVEVTLERALTGSHSAVLRMDEGPDATGSKIHYLVQEITPAEMPERLTGAYRVENWQRGTGKQYLQFVVIAYDPDNFPKEADNWQLRYLLAGVSTAPISIGNAKFLAFPQKTPGDVEPTQDTWVTFDVPLRQDFIDQWGLVPTNFSKLRILFEVRYDDKSVTDGTSRADVYYDSLYVGDGS